MRISLFLTLPLAAPIGCRGDERRPASAENTAPNNPKLATNERAQDPPTVDQVKESPKSFYGKQVLLAGAVDEIYGDRAFELEGTGWAFDDNITVLTRTPVTFAGTALARDDALIVSGTVRRFVTAEVERELGWDLQPEIEARLKERPVLVAESIRKVGDYGRWSTDGAATAEPVATVITIVTAVEPGALAGQKVDLGRERVQSVMGKGLWVGPSHMSQVFVLPATPTADVQAGDLVQVTGTLRKVPKDAAKTWDLPAEMSGVVREEMLFVDQATVREVRAEKKGSGS